MNDDNTGGADDDPTIPPFEYHRNPDGTIMITGEIDMATAESMRPVLLASTDPVSLDLSNVTFMDSAGVKLLLLAKRRRPVHIVATSPAVQRVLDVLGLADAFE